MNLLWMALLWVLAVMFLIVAFNIAVWWLAYLFVVGAVILFLAGLDRGIAHFQLKR